MRDDFTAPIKAQLAEASFSGKTPVRALQYLPEWCLYIEWPDPVTFYGKTFFVFFAMFSLVTGIPELFFAWTGKGQTACEIDGLPLTGSLEESIQHMMNTVIAKRTRTASGTPFSPLNSNDKKDLRARFGFALPILLYLASVNAQVRSRDHDQSMPQKQECPDITKKGKIKLPAPRVSDGEWRYGPSLPRGVWSNGDETDQGPVSTHRSPRPHIRAAHFHHYWVGPKKRSFRAETHRGVAGAHRDKCRGS